MFPSKSNYIQFIPLGTDTKYFSPLTLPEEKTVLSVGRDPGRDFKTLIDAVKGTDIHLKLTAKPSQLEKLQPLPLNVTIHDFSPDELIQEYAKAAIIMLPLKPRHTNDSMGCSTLVEAMAMGKAVVATNTTTMSSYITSGVNGVLVPESDVNTLRETLRSLHTDSSKRNMLGSAAREYVLKTCDASIFAHTLAGFFKQIVEE
jgi:glycosyltransferase involved in cell wall biosynthesis